MRKDKKFDIDNLLNLLLLLLISPLFFAYIAQYFFDFQPCVLCLYQRKPFFISVVVIVIYKIYQKFYKNISNIFLKKLIFFLVIFLLLANSLLAFYHVGVEQGLFVGPSSCSGTSNLNNINNLQELSMALAKAKAVNCSKPTFILPFISMALANLIYCLTVALLSIFLYRKLKL